MVNKNKISLMFSSVKVKALSLFEINGVSAHLNNKSLSVFLIGMTN